MLPSGACPNGGIEVPVCQQGNPHMLCDEVKNGIHVLAFQDDVRLETTGSAERKKELMQQRALI